MNNKLIQFVCGLILSILSISVMASVRCEDVFIDTQIGREPPVLTTLEWKHWVSSWPASNVNANYAENARLALIEVFAPWIQAGKENSFIDMIRTMHLVSTMGIKGSGGPYKSGTYDTSEIFPGKTRLDVDIEYSNLTASEKVNAVAKNPWYAVVQENNSLNVPLLGMRGFDSLGRSIDSFLNSVESAPTFKSNGDVDRNAQLTLVKIPNRKYIINVKLTNPVSEKSNYYRTSNGLAYAIEWDNQLPGISDTSSVSKVKIVILEIGGRPVRIMPNSEDSHTTPHPKQLPAYFAAAEKKIEVLKQNYASFQPVVKQDANLTSRQKQFLSILADYYQIMICAHPFTQVNNSIFMNQINYFLWVNGFKPLYHGHLDFWSMTLQNIEFRRFFIDEVIEQLAIGNL